MKTVCCVCYYYWSFDKFIIITGLQVSTVYVIMQPIWIFYNSSCAEKKNMSITWKPDFNLKEEILLSSSEETSTSTFLP